MKGVPIHIGFFVFLAVHPAARAQELPMDTQVVRLETALVFEKASNVGWEVMQKVINTVKDQRQKTANLQCSTYAKSSYTQGGRSHLFEFLSVSRRERPTQYNEWVVAADQHLSEGEGNFGNSMEMRASFSGRSQFMGEQRPPEMGRHFYEGYQDGDVDLFSATINMPKIFSLPLPSPLASDAGVHFRYKLVDILRTEPTGEKIYVVQFDALSVPGYMGTVWVREGDWFVNKSAMVLTGGALTAFQSMTMVQRHVLDEGSGANVVVDRDFQWKDGTDTGRVTVRHSHHVFNDLSQTTTMRLAVRAYAPDAFTQSAHQWERLRPIPLALAEQTHVHYQDSLALYYDSDAYVDSVDREYNTLKWHKPLLTGMGYRSRKRGISVYVDPIIAQFRPFCIGGYRHNIGGSITRTFDNDQRLTLDGYANYGFANRDLKGEISIHYRYNPRRFGDMEWAYGDDYMMVNTYESILGTFARGNYARRKYFTAAQRMEWFNGVYVRTSLDFSERSSIAGLVMDNWSDGLFGTLNPPQDFPTYTVAIFGVQLLIRPYQRYIFKGNRKFVLGSPYPDIELEYRWGIPKLFGSDVKYHLLRIEARDFVRWPRLGYSEWSAGAGSFFGSNLDSIRFIEHKYFRGSDKNLFSMPNATFQALDSTYHTARPYLEFYGVHHFEGAILNRIPWVRRLKFQAAVGASGVLIPSISLQHVETFVGLEHTFRLNKQLFKYGFYRVFRPGDVVSSGYRFKLGINTYDSYRGRWLY